MAVATLVATIALVDTQQVEEQWVNSNKRKMLLVVYSMDSFDKNCEKEVYIDIKLSDST